MKALSLLFAIVLLAFSSVSFAQTLSEGTYRRLTKIHELIGEDQLDEAESKLKSLMSRVKRNAYEHAMVLQTYGFVEAQRGSYKAAAYMFKQAIGLDALPPQQVDSMKVNLAQFYMAIDQYSDAIATLEDYLKTTENPVAAVTRILLATGYAQTKQFRKAITQVTRGIKESKKPQEMWYQLKVALHFELRDYSGAARTLKSMLRLFPLKAEYWTQLSGMLLELKKDKEALAILALADRQDFLDTGQKIKNLAFLYLYLDTPYKAAKLLAPALNDGTIERTDKNWELLSNCWLAAREYDKSIEALHRAAKLTRQGDLWLRLGMLHMEQENWDKVGPALRRARELGIDKPGQAALVQGIAASELGDLAAALKAFRQAKKYEETKDQATAWTQHIIQLQAEAEEQKEEAEKAGIQVES